MNESVKREFEVIANFIAEVLVGMTDEDAVSLLLHLEKWADRTGLHIEFYGLPEGCR